MTVTALFAAHHILQSADRVLHLAGSLVGLAFSFQLLVAQDLSGGFFHGSLGLLCRTVDSVFNPNPSPYPYCFWVCYGGGGGIGLIIVIVLILVLLGKL